MGPVQGWLTNPSPLAVDASPGVAAGVYYATRLRGASNEKARHELNFRPRPLEWLQGRAVSTQHG
jgi:2-alkyl-3-oxoalkanoate reductase